MTMALQLQSIELESGLESIYGLGMRLNSCLGIPRPRNLFDEIKEQVQAFCDTLTMKCFCIFCTKGFLLHFILCWKR